VSKDELRQKLSELYKSSKDQVSCFGFRTQYGGGKSTGFALVYDSTEAMKKFEPRYRLIRYGQATKIERASRQQREYRRACSDLVARILIVCVCRQTEEESSEGASRYGEGKGCGQGQEEIDGFRLLWRWIWGHFSDGVVYACWRL
jgi:ribosomal protein S24E